MIPTSSREAALAGLALYAACRPGALWAQRVAWMAIRLLGPRVLPGRSIPWISPAPPEIWQELASRWERELGAFDSVAGYRRLDYRKGGALLLLRRGEPVAFVKLRDGNDAALHAERRLLELVWRSRPRSFSVPQPLGAGEVRGWHYLATAALPPRLHRPPHDPPLKAILEEKEAALASLPRPAGTPAHWRAMHGDFTPWNLRQIDSRMFLIDWEDAGWGPPDADRVLYRATEAALWGRTVARSDAHEAIRFWEQRVSVRPLTSARDERLRASLLAALHRMRTAGWSSPADAPRFTEVR